MADTNQVILRIALDEGKTEDQLKKLVLDIEAVKNSQTLLNNSRKAGNVEADTFAQKSVELTTKLRGLTQEQSALTKNLELYRTAQSGEADGYKATQAALSLALRQQQELAGSANNSSEASQALTKQIAQYRETLAATDAQQGAFFRNIGNYPKGESLEPLIQKLVQLQEIEKQLPAGSEKAAQAQRQIGFEYANLNKQAAAAGLSQKDLTAKLTDYGERVRPATAELAKLTIAQDEVAKSAGKESEEFAKIGFQIGAARKQVAAVPAELSKVNPAAEAATKALGDTATKGLGLLGEQGEKAAGLLGKFRSGTDLVSKGMSTLKGAGETGSLGFKAIASGIALTGIGLFVIAISAVVSYFTQSAEGGKILAGILGGLGAVVNLLTSTVTGLGKGLVDAATNPKQAFQDLVNFLEGQVLNRLKSFAVVIEGVKSGNIKQIANGFLQMSTGVEDVIGKVSKFGETVIEAGKAGQALVLEQKALIKARRELEIEDVKEQSRVAVLLRLSKERGKSASDQLAALKEAGRIEASLTEKNIALQRRELAAINESIRQKGALKSADLIADRAAKEKEIAQTLAAQDEVNAKIKVRESTFIQQQNAAAAAAAKQRAKDVVLEEQAKNNTLLAEVQKETFAELELKKKAIDLAAQLELAGEKKTKAQITEVLATAARAKSDLEEAFADKSAEAEKKRLAAQATEAKREYDEATRLLGEYLDRKRAQVEHDYAEGKIGENQYQKAINEIDAAGLRAQMVVNDDYRQDNAKAIKAAADLEIREHKRVVAERKKIEETKQEITKATLEASTNASDLIIQAYGEESAAGQVALTVKKTLALAEIGLNLEKQLAANALAAAKIAEEYPYVGPALAAAYKVTEDALAISGAAASAAKILGFRQGGVAYGPSHEQGGIQMYHKSGAHMGEFEGGEVILTKGVWDNPLLRPLASALNVMGGGAPLMPRPHMAVGGVGQPLILDQLRGGAAPLNEVAIGRAIADSLRKNPAVNRWVDFEKAQARNVFKDTQANS